MKKLSILLAFFMLVGFVVQAQQKITGTVTSADDGMPIPGVSIYVKGNQSLGTATNIDGQYSISLPEDAEVLVFTAVGMTATEVAIEGRSVIDVAMEPEALEMDEVIVVAYGTTKKSSFTGSASVIKADKIESAPVESFEKALQGNTAGLQVTTASGAPGSATTMRIRGVGSLNASSQPLYVIDGVPVSTSNYSEVASADYGTSSSPLSSLNPADIESITVLKDASAASLYGSRAANGVVIITTKSGKSGDAKIRISATTGVNTYAVEPHKVLGAEDYYRTYFNYYVGQGLDAASANSQTISALEANPFNNSNPLDADGNLTDGTSLMYDTDWRDQIYQTGKMYDVNVSASGGNERTTYYVSGGYLNQEGNVVGYDYERYSAKFNLTSQLKDNIKVGINNTLSMGEQNTPAGGGGAANAVRFSNIVASVYPLYQRDADGNVVVKDGVKQYDYNNPIVLDFNPVGINEMDIYQSRTARVLTTAFAEITLMEGLKFKTQGSVDYNHISETRYYNPEHGNGASVGGRANRYEMRDFRTNITNTLNYNKKIDDNNSINIQLGQEAFKSEYRYLSGGKTSFIFGGTEYMIAASTPASLTDYITEKTLNSYFSSAKYNHADKYYVDFSYRRDGSSVFGKDSRWGNFYSFGATWRITQEEFMNGLSWVNDLKIRGSYGTSGNDNIGRYDALGQLGFGYNYNGSAGMFYDNMANPVLEWEKGKILDIGLEFRIFDRLNGTLDFYKKTSSDLLFDKPLSFSSGFEDLASNLAEMTNTGIEVLLTSNNIRTQDFSWDTDFNISFNKNEITKLTQDQLIVGSKRWREGIDRYQFYIQEWAGVDAATGEPMWYKTDENGDKVLTKNYNEADRYEQGSALPDFFGGLTNTFKYKNFDFSFFFYFSVGGQIYDYTEADMMHDGGEPGQQLAEKTLDSWKENGDVTYVPEFIVNNGSQSNERSTRFLYDGSYLRLKNVSLGYTLPQKWAKKVKLSNMRVYVQASNVWTLTEHEGLDPEVSLAGTTDQNVPPVKTLSFGINMNF